MRIEVEKQQKDINKAIAILSLRQLPGMRKQLQRSWILLLNTQRLVCIQDIKRKSSVIQNCGTILITARQSVQYQKRTLKDTLNDRANLIKRR